MSTRKVNIGWIVSTEKEMRPREQHDYYPTPLWIANRSIEVATVEPSQAKIILDTGAGQGEWGLAIKWRYRKSYLIGIDQFHTIPEDSGISVLYDQWIAADYLETMIDCEPDLIVGNPPYSLAEEFVRHSFTHLPIGGEIVYLLRLSFLEGQDRGKNFWTRYPLHSLNICSKRPSFTGNGKTDATAYAVYHWIKGDKNPLPIRFIL